MFYRTVFIVRFRSACSLMNDGSDFITMVESLKLNEEAFRGDYGLGYSAVELSDLLHEYVPFAIGSMHCTKTFVSDELLDLMPKEIGMHVVGKSFFIPPAPMLEHSHDEHCLCED